MEEINQYTPQAAALSTGGNVLSVGLQSVINRRAERRAWNRNVKMWHLQNEYNSPVQQMKRLKDAGLNPHLMYGKGTVGNAQNMPAYSAIPTQGMGDMFGKSLAGVQGMYQIQEKKEEIAILQINKEIREATAVAETMQKIDQQAITWYQKAITAIDATQKKYGLDSADSTLKVLFQSMMQGQADKPEEYTEDKIVKVLQGIVITKEVSKVLSSLGFGALIGRATKGTKSKGPKETQTITTKTGKNRTVKVTRSNY